MSGSKRFLSLMKKKPVNIMFTGLQNRKFFIISLPTFLEKSDRVAEADAATDLGRELLDERQMVAVQLVGQIVGVERKNMREMLAGDRV